MNKTCDCELTLRGLVADRVHADVMLLPIHQDSTDFVDYQYSSGFATGFLQFAQTHQISAAACLAV